MSSTASGEERLYKSVSIFLAVVFAVVGVIFLIAPDAVLSLFNSLSDRLGMQIVTLQGGGFYLIIAVAYMYTVTLLAMQMFRRPGNRVYPFVLINAKAASSVVSLFFFIFVNPYLVFLANCVVDGTIAVIVAILNTRMKRALA